VVEVQKMTDLPEDRLTPGPPFFAVGADTFGPWNVTTRRTRGGAAQSKRWAIIFTILSHTPPMWEECGELNFQTDPVSP
jgi:hypothetical protein